MPTRAPSSPETLAVPRLQRVRLRAIRNGKSEGILQGSPVGTWGLFSVDPMPSARNPPQADPDGLAELNILVSQAGSASPGRDARTVRVDTPPTGTSVAAGFRGDSRSRQCLNAHGRDKDDPGRASQAVRAETRLATGFSSSPGSRGPLRRLWARQRRIQVHRADVLDGGKARSLSKPGCRGGARQSLTFELLGQASQAARLHSGNDWKRGLFLHGSCSYRLHNVHVKSPVSTKRGHKVPRGWRYSHVARSSR